MGSHWVWGLGFRGLGSRGLGFRVEDLGLRVEGLGVLKLSRRHIANAPPNKFSFWQGVLQMTLSIYAVSLWVDVSLREAAPQTSDPEPLPYILDPKSLIVPLVISR